MSGQWRNNIPVDRDGQSAFSRILHSHCPVRSHEAIKRSWNDMEERQRRDVETLRRDDQLLGPKTDRVPSIRICAKARNDNPKCLDAGSRNSVKALKYSQTKLPGTIKITGSPTSIGPTQPCSPKLRHKSRQPLWNRARPVRPNIST